MLKNNVKKICCLFMALFLSVESFAAVVSDNDGSAFITKAEFDSLKNNFQSQLDAYNTGIDNKIDTAIASYLAGITVDMEPSELWSSIMYATNNKFRWASFNLPESSTAANIVNNTIVNTTRYHNHPECNAYTGYRAHGDRGGDPTGKSGVIYQVGDTATHAKGVTDESGLCARSYVFDGGTYVQEYTSWDSGYHGAISSLTTSAKSNTFYNSNIVTTGKGKLWDFNILPNGEIELKKYNSSAYIDNTVEIIGYTYKKNTVAKNSWSNFSSIYCTANGANYTTGITINVPRGTKYNGGTTGSIPSSNPYGQTSNWNYGKQTISWKKVDDGIDYSFYYWGTNTLQTAYGITNESEPDWASVPQVTGYSTGTSTSARHTYKRVYFPYTGDTTENVQISNIKYTYYDPKVIPQWATLNYIENQYVSDQAAEVVRHGQGAPAIKAESDDAHAKVKDIKLYLYDKGNPTTPIGGDVRFMISKNKFNNGAFASASDQLFDATVTVPSSGEITFSMNDADAFTLERNGDIAWINIYDTSGIGLVKLDSLKPVLVTN